jgi:hypothetical protein
MFAREDWTYFHSLTTLGQKAGIPVQRLRRLVVKELTDNALDTGAAVRFYHDREGTLVIDDDGPGLEGSPTEIAALFSIRRPLTSSKLLRLPTRGALGNGLRVVAGAVLASSGHLEVWTRGQRIQLRPQDSGDTWAETTPIEWPRGTRVAVRLGPTIPIDPNVWQWAFLAQRLATGHSTYKGKPSPYWFDSDSFYELCQAAGTESIRALVARLDGCTRARAGQITQAFHNRAARDLSRAEALAVLQTARQHCRLVSPERLGYIGRQPHLPDAYARTATMLQLATDRGGVPAVLPIMIEAWADVQENDKADAIDLCVNRTPVAADVEIQRMPKKRTVAVFGCGLEHSVAVKHAAPCYFLLNIQAPALPLTSDGKTPDLTGLVGPIIDTLEQAGRRAKNASEATSEQIKDVCWPLIPEAYMAASDNNTLPAKARQIGYAARERSLARIGRWYKNMDTFTQEVLPEFIEARIPSLPRTGMSPMMIAATCKSHTQAGASASAPSRCATMRRPGGTAASPMTSKSRPCSKISFRCRPSDPTIATVPCY